MRALLIVDVQNDFLPGGALGIEGGGRVIPVINALQREPFDSIVACRDWHPKGHVSFASTHGKRPYDKVELLGGEVQILWPDHCVQGTQGAAFSPQLDQTKVERVFDKGVDVERDSYSAFFDNQHVRSTGLGAYLKDLGVDTIYIAGLATDYCVLFSARDALSLGFSVVVVENGCQAIGDEKEALQKLLQLGAKVISFRGGGI